MLAQRDKKRRAELQQKTYELGMSNEGGLTARERQEILVRADITTGKNRAH